jgi:hypothetical protein
VVSVAEALDRLIGQRLWDSHHFTAELRFLRLVYNPLFLVAHTIEELARPRRIAPVVTARSLMAASPVSDPYSDPNSWIDAWQDDEDDLDDTRSVDDYRYDY